MGSAQGGRLCVFGTQQKTCAAVGQQFVCTAASCRAAQGKKSRVITGRVQRVYSRASETNATRRRPVKYSSSRQTTTTTATRSGSQTLTDRARPWPPIHNTLLLSHDSKPLSRVIQKKKIIQMVVEERRGGGGQEKKKKKREKSQIKMCRTRQTCEYTVFRLQLLGNKCFGGKPSLRGIFNVSLIATLADRHISLLISGHDYRLRR